MIFADNKALVCFEPKAASQLRLFCFPCAGGAATMYRPWSQWHPDTELWAANYPGRGTLHNLPLAEKVESIVELFLQQKELFNEKPFALYGHSFGALIAFLVAYELERLGLKAEALFVSSRRAPQLPTRFSLTDLSDAQFLFELDKLGGLPTAIRGNQELMDYYLPVIKSDLILNDQVAVDDHQVIDSNIYLFSADGDKVAEAEELNAWKNATNNRFNHAQLSGDHFFIQDSESQFRSRISQHLQQLTGTDAEIDEELIVF